MAAHVLLSAAILLSLAVSIWAIADVAMTPAAAFGAAGLSRKQWLMLLVFFTIALDAIGIVLAVAYFTLIRPKVRPLKAA